jgi:regulatory protein
MSTPESMFLAEDQKSSAALSVDALRGRALAMLTRREHSRAELQKKLSEQGGHEAVIGQVLDELVERRLQSDARFAEVFVRSRAEKGYGPRAISVDLRARGLDAETIATAMAASGYDWAALAADTRRRRFGTALPKDVRERARQLRFLQYRGFTGEHIGPALNCDDLPGS